MELERKSQKHPNTLKSLYKKPGMLLLTLAILLIGAITTAFFLLSAGPRINHDGYQIVYMVSGQVYFGKLQNTSGEYFVLETPYTAQSVTTTSDNEQSDTTLLRVSQQAYGPEDVISLKSDQVLFWQNLRSDSKVSTAINKDEQ